MKKFVAVIFVQAYLLVAVVVALVLMTDGKPLFASALAGILWGPLLIYGLFT